MLGLRRWAVAVAISSMVPVAAQDFGQWAVELGQRGFVSGAPFDVSGVDSVNAVNGNVTLNVPLAALPAGHAGLGLDVSLVYGSSMYDAASRWVGDGPPNYFHGYTQLSTGQVTPAPWLYGYQYGLYIEMRDPQPVLFGGVPTKVPGCVYNPPGAVDVPDSSESAVYPQRLLALFPDGSSHVLVQTNAGQFSLDSGWSAVNWNGAPIGCFSGNGGTTMPYPLDYVTQDGTFVRVTITGQGPGNVPAWTMQFPDGRKVIGVGTDTQQIFDRNGNVINISKTSPSCYTPLHDGSDPDDVVITLTDSFGRCVQIEEGKGGDGHSETDWITQAGPDSTTLVTAVQRTPEPIDFVYSMESTVSCQIGYEGDCDKGANNPPTNCLDNSGGQHAPSSGLCAPLTPIFVTSIDLSQAGFLPAGSPLSYSFSYGNQTNVGGACGTCQLTSVTLPRGANAAWPTGAKIQYSYGPPGGDSLEPQDMPVVTKTLTHTDPYTSASYSDNWTYVYSGVGPSIPSNIVTNPDGSKTNYYTYPPGTAFGGRAFKIDKLDRGGNLLSDDARNSVEICDPRYSTRYAVFALAATPFLIPWVARAVSSWGISR